MRIRHIPLPCLVLVLCFALPGGPPADASDLGVPLGEDLKKKKAEILFRLKVNRAIDNGAHWIAQQQRPDGTFKLEGNVGDGVHPMHRQTFGRTVLCFYTLADCGYAPDHAVIKKALAYLRGTGARS